MGVNIVFVNVICWLIEMQAKRLIWLMKEKKIDKLTDWLESLLADILFYIYNFQVYHFMDE